MPRSASGCGGSDPAQRGSPAGRATAIAELADDALIARVESLSRRERCNTLEILLHLIEVERRELWRPLEYRSMFDYCVRRLRYSEGAASRRIRTARLLVTYPYVYDRIRSGRLSLCAVSKIARAVLERGRRDLIDRIEGKRLDQVDAILAVHRDPSRPVRESIRLLCVERPVSSDEAAPGAQPPLASPPSGRAGATPAAGAASPDGARHGENGAPTPGNVGESDSGDGASREGAENGVPGGDVTAGAALHRQNDGKKATRIERVYRFQFGVDARTMTKFARVQSLAAIRAGGNVDLSALFEVLCDTYLERYDAATRADRRAEREDRRATGDGTDRRSAVKRVRRAGAGVPPAVRDRVIHRDGGRCTFVDRNGQRCTETIALQVDHVKPAAIGGTDRESNLRAMCPAHNRLLAERTFGRGTVERAIEAPRPRSRKPG